MVAAALLVSACGSSASSNGEAKKAGSQVAKDAGAALTASGAVHATGSLTGSSTKQPIGLDIQLQSDGTSGTLMISGNKVDLISTGGTAYIKAPAGFFQGGGGPTAAASKLANRWVKLPASSGFESFTLSSIAKNFAEPSAGKKVNAEVKTDTLDGKDVVIASESDGTKLYVASTGKPYPLKLTGPSSGSGGTVTFSDFGKQQDIKAPAGAIDLPAAGS